MRYHMLNTGSMISQRGQQGSLTGMSATGMTSSSATGMTGGRTSVRMAGLWERRAGFWAGVSL